MTYKNVILIPAYGSAGLQPNLLLRERGLELMSTLHNAAVFTDHVVGFVPSNRVDVFFPEESWVYEPTIYLADCLMKWLPKHGTSGTVIHLVAAPLHMPRCLQDLNLAGLSHKVVGDSFSNSVKPEVWHCPESGHWQTRRLFRARVYEKVALLGARYMPKCYSWLSYQRQYFCGRNT